MKERGPIRLLKGHFSVLSKFKLFRTLLIPRLLMQGYLSHALLDSKCIYHLHIFSRDVGRS